jgi:nitrogen PTS system EIIA component
MGPSLDTGGLLVQTSEFSSGPNSRITKTMPHADFDVQGLAEFLHLTPRQVERAVDRGKLPGRKVAGKWRFSRAEVHHWMEDRMGLLDDGELAHVEAVLGVDHSCEPDEETTIAGMIPMQAIAAPLLARTRRSVVTAMVDLGKRSGLLWDHQKMAEAVLAREEMMSTALDNGVALLHPRRPLPNILSQAFLALGVTPGGIPFGGSRMLTDVFFLICSTSDKEHLRTLARLSRLIGDEDLLSAMRHAPDADSIRTLVAQREKELLE